MSVSDIGALQKWASLTQNIKRRILDNVFCSSCGVTTIKKYSLHDETLGILLKGTCNKCGQNVARFIENE